MRKSIVALLIVSLSSVLIWQPTIFFMAGLFCLPIGIFAIAVRLADSESRKEWLYLIDLLYKMGYNTTKISTILDIYF